MSNFFRKIASSLVVLGFVSVVLSGRASALEDDTPAVSPDVDVSAEADIIPDSAAEKNETVIVSGSDVILNVDEHSFFSVASIPSDDLEESDDLVPPDAESGTLALTETIRSLFGSYTPRTQTVTTYYNGEAISTDEQIIPGLAGLDYEWLVGVGIFSIMLYCLFRLLGGVLRNG